MPQFIVGIREVHVSNRLIEAVDEEDAVERAGDEGEEITCEYSHTLAKDVWTVESQANGKERS